MYFIEITDSDNNKHFFCVKANSIGKAIEISESLKFRMNAVTVDQVTHMDDV